jgi:hypothetical protein
VFFRDLTIPATALRLSPLITYSPSSTPTAAGAYRVGDRWQLNMWTGLRARPKGQSPPRSFTIPQSARIGVPTLPILARQALELPRVRARVTELTDI